MQQYYQRASAALCTKGSPILLLFPPYICYQEKYLLQSVGLGQKSNLGLGHSFSVAFCSALHPQIWIVQSRIYDRRKERQKIPPDRWQYFVAVWQGIDLSFATIIEGKSHVILILIYITRVITRAFHLQPVIQILSQLFFFPTNMPSRSFQPACKRANVMSVFANAYFYTYKY